MRKAVGAPHGQHPAEHRLVSQPSLPRERVLGLPPGGRQLLLAVGPGRSEGIPGAASTPALTSVAKSK